MEVSTIYNPHEQTEQELLDGFVIREKEFKTIFQEIQKNKMQTPPQHYIIYGVRGNGKTSLLLKLFYEVRRDEDLNKWLIPIVFKEEQYNIRTLFKLWENIAEHLEDDYKEFAGLADKMEQLGDSDDYEEKCFEALQLALESNGKKIVLLFDNFGDFLNKLKDREHQRLREVLITCSDIRIVGASTFVDETTYDYGKPFFDFFKPVYLKGLNKEDTIKLLLKLNEKATSGDVKQIIENNPGRIEALRRLTSGIPRTIVLLYQIFVDNANGSSFKDLDSLLDKVTPLYKARMDDLSPQQQEITDIIAKNWDAISVNEIVPKAKMPSNAVSAQLKQLEKNRIIEKKETSTKNNLYQISERFFNIWYLMRYSRRKDKCKVRWLVNFLEIWCDKKELRVRAKSHIEGLKTGKLYDKYAYHLSEAYAQMVSSPKMQHELIVSTREYLKSVQSDYLNELSDSDIELEREALKELKNDKPEIALTKLFKIERKNKAQLFLLGFIYHEFMKDFKKAEEFYLLAVKKNVPEAMFNLGRLYDNEFKDYQKAEEYYLMAVERGDTNAMFSLGYLYKSEYNDYKKAEKYYLMAVEKGDTDAMVSIGYLYKSEFKDYKKAEEYYTMAVEKGDVNAMFNLGYLYNSEFKDYKKAEEFYLMAVEKGNTKAMFNLGYLYNSEFKDYKRAEEYYLMAVEKGNTDAMFNLGSLYKNEFKDYKKTEEFYLMAVENGDTDAMSNLGSLYKNEFKDYKRAEEYYLMAIEKGETGAMFNLGYLYDTEFKNYKRAQEYYLMAVEKGNTEAMFNLGYLYENEFEDLKKAEEYYLMAVGKGDADSMFNLSNLYYNEYKDYKKAEKYYLMAVEKGETKAMFNLGYLYDNEFKDYKKAEKFYLMAVEKGNIDAMVNLGSLYKNDFEDYQKAVEFYLMAIEKGDSRAMFALGILYNDEYKDYQKAEEYYLMAVEKGDIDALNSLAWMFFELKKNKIKALEYARQAFEGDKNVYNAHTYSCILLWYNEIEKAIVISSGFLNNEESYTEFSKDIELFLLLLLAKKQYHFVLNLFKENKFEIQDRYKPIYYALMSLMQNEFPDEIKRMGSELEETVLEILQEIERLSKDYA
jgi:TPR repeat protein